MVSRAVGTARSDPPEAKIADQAVRTAQPQPTVGKSPQSMRAEEASTPRGHRPAGRLSRSAKLLRVFHIALAVLGLGSLGYLWVCAVTGQRDRWLALAIGWLVVEGVAVLIGHGNCPLGPLQRRLGDPTPCFELVLPPRAAKAAFPVLFVLTAGGLGLLAWRTYL